jgi:hypothetical protein
MKVCWPKEVLNSADSKTALGTVGDSVRNRDTGQSWFKRQGFCLKQPTLWLPCPVHQVAVK